MDLGLEGAAVCVNGGSRGLGRAVALAFAREGARVVIAARDPEALQGTVEALHEAGAADAFGVPTDLGRRDSIERLFEEIESRWGELNTLINMAAHMDPSEGADFTEVPDEEWNRYFDVGVISHIRSARAAVPLMRKAGWGRIVNISSISSRLGIPQEGPYMTAKSAMNALSKNMAWALAKDGILVNTVTPGVFWTEGLSQFIRNAGGAATLDPNDLVDCWQFTHEFGGGRYNGVIGRIARAEELSPLLLLLGSRANSYIVGANIPVDGGTDFSAP